MTQEDKQLLLKDICSRLPYGVKVLCISDSNHKWYNVKMVDIEDNEVYLDAHEPYTNRYAEIEDIKPYLFPLSSMTEEQKQEYAHIVVMSSNLACSQLIGMTVQDWLNAHHFDYRGLIEKGLAIDATGKNIY